MSAKLETLAQAIHRDPILGALALAQTRHQLFPISAAGEPAAAVVGVSGGGDSVCLLHALARLAAAWRLQLTVAHLDHALRPDSAQDAALVEALAGHLGLACEIYRLAPGALAGSPDGLEAAARQARYAFLCRVADRVTPPAQIPIVVVAHHSDDQAETLIMHFVRGSGLRGLAGMRWSTARTETGIPRPVRIVRPLLAVTRSAIRRYLAACNLSWREDPSNADTSLLRNRIRRQVLPDLVAINPNLVETLGRAAQVLADEAARAEALDRAAFDQVVAAEIAAVHQGGGAHASERIVLDAAGLLSLDRATQRGVLRLALAHLRVDLRAAGAARVETLLWDLAQRRCASGPHTLTQGIAWTLTPAYAGGPLRLSLHRDDALPLTPDHPQLPAGWTATVPPAGSLGPFSGWRLVSRVLAVDRLPTGWREDLYSAYLDLDRAPHPVLTTPGPGLRFAPLGMHGHRKLLGDFFTDRKVPAAARAGWPIVVDGDTGDVLWVCGHAIAHGPRITAETRQVLSLVWVRPAAGGEAEESCDSTAAAGASWKRP